MGLVAAICLSKPTLIEIAVELQGTEPGKMTRGGVLRGADYFAIVMLGTPVRGMSVTVI